MLTLETLSTFLPIDRRQALAAGATLPDRVVGAALFADISGFTPLTAALSAELGRQRGAEEVLNYINPVYEAIIGQLHQYRGSVISFAGDSITCWFDAGPNQAVSDACRRAVAAALAMQQVMGNFATIRTAGGSEVALAIKIGIAAGPARRFLAGDPDIHNFEALAGDTIARMAAAEGQAQKGDVIASQEVASYLSAALQVAEWREDDENGGRFAVVAGLNENVEPIPWPLLADGALSEAQLRPWLDEPVFGRLCGGAGFLAELRPATSLFLKFSGIDYDGDDDAGRKLDAFIRWVQGVLTRYEGTMLQLTIGDKGSNLLAVFGAPIAHDDDPARAVAAALDLQQPLPPEVSCIGERRIGISQGIVWAGACGGRLRCIYSVMGDEVNMAARLMGKAEPGQTLVNQPVAQTTGRLYRYQFLGAIPVKGKVEPLPVSAALGRQSGVAAAQPTLFANTLVGRETALAELHGYLAAAGAGEGQVVRLEGVAGVGKSHLAAVFARQAVESGWQVAIGTCQSINQEVAYTPWRQLLSTLLELPGEGRAAYLAEKLGTANPDWRLRLPLLGDLLGLAIPDNETTAGLEPRLRQQALFALVGEIIQWYSQQRPLLLWLDDIHWLDELSAELTITISRLIGRLPVLLLLGQRPPLDDDRPLLPALDHLPGYHFMPINDLTPEGVAALVEQRLGGRPNRLVRELVLAQAQGNPFFTEELVDALREAGYIEAEAGGGWQLSSQAYDALLDARCIHKVEGKWHLVENPPLHAVNLDLPTSVHSTVLARMDRLAERPKLALKVASVIGRTFHLELLQAAHPNRPPLAELEQDIETMGQRDFVRLEAAGEAKVYLFKHNTTQEVAYGTLLFAQRQGLHAAVARWHEQSYGNSQELTGLTLESPLAPYYPLLVHHWHRAENWAREGVYAGLAGEQAAKQYANEGAVRYFSRAIALAPAGEAATQYRLLLGREKTYNIQAKREAQAEDLQALRVITQRLRDSQKKAAVYLEEANFHRVQNDYPAAEKALRRAIQQARKADDLAAETTAYQMWGYVLRRQDRPQAAKRKWLRAIRLAKASGALQEEARSLYGIGSLYFSQAKLEQAGQYYQQAQTLFDTLGDQRGKIDCLLMFGGIHNERGHYTKAQQYYQEALALCRVVGWRYGETVILNNLANSYFELGDYETSQTHHLKIKEICREIGDRLGEALSLDTLSLISDQVKDGQAFAYNQEGVELVQAIGEQSAEALLFNHKGQILAGLGNLAGASAAYLQALQLRREMEEDSLALDDLAGLARVALRQGDLKLALTYAGEILAGLKDALVEGAEFPILVYLSCYQALQQNALIEGNPAALAQAQAILAEGYGLLQERAGRIQDQSLRQQFLNNVPFNRALLDAWTTAAPALPEDIRRHQQ